jgi:hypothetical protein
MLLMQRASLILRRARGASRVPLVQEVTAMALLSQVALLTAASSVAVAGSANIIVLQVRIPPPVVPPYAIVKMECVKVQ